MKLQVIDTSICRIKYALIQAILVALLIKERNSNIYHTHTHTSITLPLLWSGSSISSLLLDPE